MQEILAATEIAEKVLNKQKRRNADKGLRRMLFCIEQEFEDGILLYNVMTKRMVLLEQGEVKKREQELFENWFLVEDDFNDIKGCRELSSLASLFTKKKKGLTGYTILPTTGCNARCFYCFEQGANPIHMDEAKALDVAKYIETTHQTEEKIHIHWFGGEPLMGTKAINTISNYLREHNIQFSSDIVSNGYLFTPELIETAKSIWNLSKVQITLDGTEDVYNKAKAYVYKLGSPYKKVIKNIKALAEANIKVNIRLNIDLYNAEDLMTLAEELNKEFSNKENISVYSHVLFENEGEERTDSDRKLLYDKMKRLQEKLKMYGLYQDKKQRLERQIKLNRCMSDNDESVLIAPDGSLGKCEHYVDKYFFGHIDSQEKDKAMLQKFKNRLPEFEACKTCPVFPNCIRLEMCNESGHCYPEEQEEKIEQIKRAMLNEYKIWKGKKQASN